MARAAMETKTTREMATSTSVWPRCLRFAFVILPVGIATPILLGIRYDCVSAYLAGSRESSARADKPEHPAKLPLIGVADVDVRRVHIDGLCECDWVSVCTVNRQ